MSSPRDYTPYHEIPVEKLFSLLRNPVVKVRLDAPVRIDRTFEIPYLAGYNRTGTVVYIDKMLPRTFPSGNAHYSVDPFLLVHEKTEKALIDALGWTYQEAHKVATLVEHLELYFRVGVQPDTYEDFLRPYVKKALHQRLVNVPPDLDLTPYQDTHDYSVLKKLQEAQ